MNKKQALFVIEDIIDSSRKKDNSLDLIMIPEIKDFSKEEHMEMEYDALGYYLKENPLNLYKNRFSQLTPTRKLAEKKKDDPVVVGGRVFESKTVVTKFGKTMAFLKIEDLVGKVEIVVFSHLYPRVKDLIEKNQIIEVFGTVEETSYFIGDEEKSIKKIIAKSITRMQESKKTTGVIVDITSEKNNEEIKKIVNKYPGDITIAIEYYPIRFILNEKISQEGMLELEKICKVNRQYEES